VRLYLSTLLALPLAIRKFAFSGGHEFRSNRKDCVLSCRHASLFVLSFVLCGFHPDLSQQNEGLARWIRPKSAPSPPTVREREQ